ncbi:protein-cysteine N-palmitoyltransferase Rasp [Leptinotarsa decemlineata]|uniref:protein-cysteine N-palmitoyltransferase Rasp n=1 Tax=Leptinotarsa decemlineata TaxID=7539 RepID=UPI000C2543F7|nr:protein-cysteine N-palmitoyltransferase Rasp [Leptinotarsa decemlineata]
MKCNVEIYFYFIIWIISVLFSIYKFSSRAKEYFLDYNDEYNDFTEGITFLWSKRDKSDLEWESINYLLSYFFPWILVYVGVAQLFRCFIMSKEVLQIWEISFTIIFILLQLGYVSLFLLLLQPVLFYSVMCLRTETIYTWICSCTSIALLNVYKSLNTQEDFQELLSLNTYESYLLTMALFWLNLKCTSFFLVKPNSSNPLEFFSYCLYTPTLFTGPFILYSDFQENFVKGPPKGFRKLAKNLMIILFWYVFGNVCLHFIYVNAASLQLQLIESLDSWSLYGYGYTMGQFFHLKYVVLYGLSTSIASFENIQVPNLPRCIGRIHLYSDMWKYFDPGLYTFLLRHIYIPSITIFKNKSLSSLLCFCFIYVWHGLEKHILIWTALNFVGIIIESVLWPPSRKNVSKHTNHWERRINCLLSAPLLAVSAISSFYFFAGKEVGDVFFRRIFTDELDNTLILMLVLNCCCQVSTQLRSTTARKM